MNVVNLLRRLGENRRELARRVLRERQLMETLGNILGPRQVPNGDSSEDAEGPSMASTEPQSEANPVIITATGPGCAVRRAAGGTLTTFTRSHPYLNAVIIGDHSRQ